MKVRAGETVSYINIDLVREVSIPNDIKKKGWIYWRNGEGFEAEREDCIKVGKFLALKSSPRLTVDHSKPIHLVE